jgi:hypothetical protein
MAAGLAKLVSDKIHSGALSLHVVGIADDLRCRMFALCSAPPLGIRRHDRRQCSISSTIQYQLLIVSRATGEPRSHRARNAWSAPRLCSIRSSRMTPPSGRATDASV